MDANRFLDSIRRFDAYSKPLDDFRIKTFGGGAVTVVSGVLMVILFLSELNYYLSTEVRAELFVDISRGQKLMINIDVTFPRLDCKFLTIDAMDVSGVQQVGIEDHIYKQRLDLQGNAISEPEKEDLQTTLSAAQQQALDSKNKTVVGEGKAGSDVVQEVTTLDPNRCESCYGAETSDRKCCNTCDDVREQYKRKGWAVDSLSALHQCVREGLTGPGGGQRVVQVADNEGCRINGYLNVNKVAGNFHIAPGRSYQHQHIHVHDIEGLSMDKLNISHTIRRLSFGVDYPGMENPLDNIQVTDHKGSKMYQYYVKIVPTTYVKVNGSVVTTNQYSVTKHEKGASLNIFSSEQSLPGVFLTYELSPMMVKYTETTRSFTHFLTGVCAIIGGVFTVAGLIDSAIYHSSNVIKRKMELGKAT